MKTGFDAMGKPIPPNRLSNAYKFVKEAIPDITTEAAMSIVGKAANSLERDEPYEVLGATSELNRDLDLIDLTGRYRLVATLLTD